MILGTLLLVLLLMLMLMLAPPSSHRRIVTPLPPCVQQPCRGAPDDSTLVSRRDETAATGK